MSHLWTLDARCEACGNEWRVHGHVEGEPISGRCERCKTPLVRFSLLNRTGDEEE